MTAMPTPTPSSSRLHRGPAQDRPHFFLVMAGSHNTEQGTKGSGRAPDDGEQSLMLKVPSTVQRLGQTKKGHRVEGPGKGAPRSPSRDTRPPEGAAPLTLTEDDTQAPAAQGLTDTSPDGHPPGDSTMPLQPGGSPRNERASHCTSPLAEENELLPYKANSGHVLPAGPTATDLREAGTPQLASTRPTSAAGQRPTKEPTKPWLLFHAQSDRLTLMSTVGVHTAPQALSHAGQVRSARPPGQADHSPQQGKGTRPAQQPGAQKPQDKGDHGGVGTGPPGVSTVHAGPVNACRRPLSTPALTARTSTALATWLPPTEGHGQCPGLGWVRLPLLCHPRYPHQLNAQETRPDGGAT